MASIITRAGKGSLLTNAEVDANFTNLNADKVEASALSTVATSGDYADLTNTPTIPTNISALANDAGYLTHVVSANSTSDALRITQTGSGNALVVADESPEASPFVINAAGKIITGAPTIPIIGDVGSAGLTMVGYSANVGQGAVTQSRYDSSAAGVRPTFYKSRATDPSQTPVSVQSGDSIATLQFFADDGAVGGTGVEAARITAAVDGTPGTNDMPGRLVFSTTADGTSTSAERLRITNDGAFGFNTANAGGSSGVSYNFARIATGSVSSTSAYIPTQFASDVTGVGIGVGTSLSTAASAFTLTSLRHYQAAQGVFGAGSAVTNQYGFFVSATLVGATNNYGFYGNIPLGTNRYNFYAAGAAPNYFAGATKFNADVTASMFKVGSWTITESFGELTFACAGVNVFRVDPLGNATFAGNVTAFGVV